MRSRVRPAQRGKSVPVTAAVIQADGSSQPIGRDDISIAMDEIVNATCSSPPTRRTIKNMKLHTVLKKLLEQRQESARKAAKASGVPLSTFTGYLKANKKQVDPTHLIAIARYFGVSVDTLLGLDQLHAKLDGLPTKKLFSRWVKLTIEDIADDGDEK